MNQFRPMQAADMLAVFPMMRDAYDRHAALREVSDEVLWQSLSDCCGDNPCVSGWVMSDGLSIAGYAMCSFGYTAALAKPTVRVEELYVLPAFRAAGIGEQFLAALPELYPEHAGVNICCGMKDTGAAWAFRRCGYTVAAQVFSTPVRSTERKEAR